MYLVAPGESKVMENVKIIGCGDCPDSRKERMGSFAKHVFKAALNVDADIYHFHDPEMLKYAVKLSKMGKKVIFDSHEDVPDQIQDKPWIPKPMRKPMAKAYTIYETQHVKKLAGVITSTDYIKSKFEGRARMVESIKNYPKLDDIIFQTNAFEDRARVACYVGGISTDRGETILLEAMKAMEGYELKFAGSTINREVKNTKPANVTYLGYLDRAGVNDLYANSRVGICVLRPTANYIRSLPIKMFEYMAAGLPIVASDFPVWRDIIGAENCGTTVAFDDIEGIRKAIKYYIDNPNEAQEAGKRGRKAVLEKYNWANEADKLIAFYNKIEAL